MTFAEASRQYQVALEYDRRLQAELSETMSASSEREESSAILAKLRADLFAEWLTRDPA